MNNYIPIICFLLGTITGAVLMYIGFLLGFRSSYEIRAGKTELPENTERTGLFGKREKDPAEFDMLDEDENKKKKGLI
jgi:hypothetical protein